MSDILIEDGDLRLRRADPDDLDYILELQADPENAPFIIAFDREFHQNVIGGEKKSMTSLIIEKADGERCGYFLLNEYDKISYYIWHMIVDGKHKGRGLGHRALRLIKRWVFDVLNWHRLMIDSKDFNERALHLYKAEGFQQEALFREMLSVDGEYQNLIMLAILRREFDARKEEQSC